MSVIVKLPSGNWRAQVRRKGRYVSGTFRRQRDAKEWALEAERSIDRGLTRRGRTGDIGDRLFFRWHPSHARCSCSRD